MSDPDPTPAPDGPEEPDAPDEKAKKRIPLRAGIGLFKRFWPYLRPEKRLSFGIGALLLLAVPSGAVAPFIVKHIFDEVLPNPQELPREEQVWLLAWLGGAIVGLTLLSFALRYHQELLALSLRNRVRFRITRDVFEKVLRLPLGYFHRTATGELMSRVRDDVAALDGLMTDTLIEAGVNVLRALLFFSLLLVLDTGLAVSGLILVAGVFGLVVLLSPALRRRSERARKADAASSAALHEAIAGMLTVRTAAQERAEARRYGFTVKEAIRTQASRDVLGTITGSSIGLVGVLGGYAIVAIGAYRILLGLSTFGSLFAFFIFLMELVGATGAVLGLAPTIQRALASLQRIYALLDEPPERGGDEPRPEAVRGEIALRDVAFRYGEGGPAALRGIDLEVEPGEVIALVGRSGAGKSTLVHLLPRLHDPDRGEVRLDGRPLASYPLRWLRERIGVVPQDVFLFNRSIRDNVAYARPDASDGQVKTAAAAAHADGFIERLPQGWETIVGERGVRLSGGEKQRIAIAREILRDPPILILDEATSSLDSESEALIRDAMARLMKGRTCFVIAHRLSTVRDADRIVVLDEGRIVEVGPHAALLEEGGVYRELHDRQMLDPAKADAGAEADAPAP